MFGIYYLDNSWRFNMAIGVSAWFDEKSEHQIRMIWKDLHERSINSTLHTGPYRPHITFGINEKLNVDKFAESIQNKLGGNGPIPFILPSIGIFTEPLAGIFNVTVTDELLKFHDTVQKLMAKYGSDQVPYYLPGRWNPHCTLAPDLTKDKLSDFAKYAAGLQLPIEGMINRIGVIDTPAEIELYEIMLA
jgi:hypothetical protein